MAKTETEEAWTQLATRIPKELHRRLKLHCVTRARVAASGARCIRPNYASPTAH